MKVIFHEARMYIFQFLWDYFLVAKISVISNLIETSQNSWNILPLVQLCQHIYIGWCWITWSRYLYEVKLDKCSSSSCELLEADPMFAAYSIMSLSPSGDHLVFGNLSSNIKCYLYHIKVASYMFCYLHMVAKYIV